MKIKTITIELTMDNAELKMPSPRPDRILVFKDNKWSSTDNDGLLSGEIRLCEAINKVRYLGPF